MQSSTFAKGDKVRVIAGNHKGAEGEVKVMLRR